MDRGVEHHGGSFPLGAGFTSEVIQTGALHLAVPGGSRRDARDVIEGMRSDRSMCARAWVGRAIHEKAAQIPRPPTGEV